MLATVADSRQQFHSLCKYGCNRSYCEMILDLYLFIFGNYYRMADEEEETVKEVIKKLRDYLQKYLSIDENFIRGLQARKLLNQTDANHFCATLSKGGDDALYSLLDHVSAYFVEETLEKFCTFLDDYSKDKIRPRLGRIAAKIRAEMKK